MEGNSSNVIAAIVGSNFQFATFGHIAQVANSALGLSTSFCVSHVCREGNRVAHCLATMDLHNMEVWVEDVPPPVHPIVALEASVSL